MASVAWHYPRTGIWRFSRRDAILVALAALHAAILAVWPVAPLIAVGVWWNSNTIAHNFIHRPFFRSAAMNRLFSAALSVLLGIPQTLWRDRHLAHHAGVEWRLRISRAPCGRDGAGALPVGGAGMRCNRAFSCWRIFRDIWPGWGCARCRGIGNTRRDGPPAITGAFTTFCVSTTDTTPSTTPLPRFTGPTCRAASRPARLPARGRRCCAGWMYRRWRLSNASCCGHPGCSASCCGRHRRAFRALLPQLQTVRRVTIVGGGLFPRTALILRELLPAAHLTIVDSDPRNLETARAIPRREHRISQRALCAWRIARLRSDRNSVVSGWRPRSDLSPSALAGRCWCMTGSGTAAEPEPSFPHRAAEASQPGAAMRSASSAPGLPAGKLAMVWGHAAPVTGWSLVAYVWQDAMVALAFAAFDIAAAKDRSANSNCLGDLLGDCDLHGNQHPGGARGFHSADAARCFAPRAGPWPIPCCSM